MKHTLKKSLAVLLAALMLLGAMAAGATASNDAAAAASEPVLTVKTTGAAEITLRYRYGSYYRTKYDLSGLVLEASGGSLSSAQTIDYDTAKKGDLQGDNIGWHVYFEGLDFEAQPGGWAAGPNKVSLYVYGLQYSGFCVEKTIGGVEYGYFETVDECFEGRVTVTLNGVEDSAAADVLDLQSAEELLLGQPKAVSIPEPAKTVYDEYEYYEDYEEAENRLFKFTPAASGKYCFRSNGARYGETYFTKDGERLTLSVINPSGTLYDEAGRHLASGSNNNGDEEHYYNFAIYYELEAGKTYYLQTTAYSGGDYTVRVDGYSKKLVVPQKEIKIKVGDYVSMADLLEGTTWAVNELEIWAYYWGSAISLDREWDGDGDGYQTKGLTGVKPGTVTLEITAPDGEYAEIEVTVKHTFWSWIRYYLLSGWFFNWINGEIPADSFLSNLGGGLTSFGMLLMAPVFPFFLLGLLVMTLTGYSL